MTVTSYVQQVTLGAPLLPNQGTLFVSLDTAAEATPWQWFNDGCLVQVTGHVNSCSIQLQRAVLADKSDAASYGAAITGDLSAGAVYADRTGGGGAYYRAVANTLGTAQTVAARTLQNLAAALNGASKPTQYLPYLPYVPLVSAVAASATTLVVTAQEAGADGNAIATTETLANGAWGAATLESGADAVAGARTGTFTNNPAAAGTVTVGTDVYTFVSALTGAANEVLIGADLTATRDNLVLAVNAGGTVGTRVGTFATNVEDGDTITIDSLTYTFKTAPAANTRELEIGVDLTASRDNLVAMLMLGNAVIPPHPTVTAVATSTDQITVSSRATGSAGNAVNLLESSSHFSWAGALTTGATGAGVNYGLGTVGHALVTASASSTDAIVITADTAGAAGNAIATTEAATNFSWAGATLTGGADAIQATGTLTLTGAVSAAETITIGTDVYTLRASSAVDAEGEIALGGQNVTIAMTGQTTLNTGVPQPIAA